MKSGDWGSAFSAGVLRVLQEGRSSYYNLWLAQGSSHSQEYLQVLFLLKGS